MDAGREREGIATGCAAGGQAYVSVSPHEGWAVSEARPGLLCGSVGGRLRQGGHFVR